MEQLRIQFSSTGAASAFGPAVTYVVVRTLAKVMSAIAPLSALVALLTAVIWLAAAVYLFFIVTWQRDDSWLAAGIIIGVSLLCGGVAADLVSRIVTTGSLGEAVVATAGASIGLLVRAVILVPLSGGFVAGARWITAELRRTDAWSG